MVLSVRLNDFMTIDKWEISCKWATNLKLIHSGLVVSVTAKNGKNKASQIDRY